MLTLEEWANEKYRSNPPSVSTLRNYAKQNMFSPQPKKKVDSGASGEDAELVGTLTTPVVKKSDPVLLQRILNDGCQTT
ncbi:excisionase [Klebsiella variicola subsp. variicola]|nr:excisionase [Klebsiella variicola subsp. variicola]